VKAGTVAIVGRPSVGKSTLLNVLCGAKISIVSSVPQTTRNKIRGILTTKKGQLIFIDTPGYHDSERKFNIHMRNLVKSAIDEIDVILYMIDSSRPLGQEEKQIMNILASSPAPIIVAVNKIDLTHGQVNDETTLVAGRKKVEAIKKEVVSALPKAIIFPISAREETGLDELEDALYEHIPEGELLYPEEIYTDQDPEFRAAEIIREKAISNARQELPHSIYVEIADMEISKNKKQLWIRAFIYVERESQKGMVVGKEGSGIKVIRKSAQAELGQLFPYRIALDLQVKVNHKWRKKDGLVKRLLT
jgi:GTPase